MFDLLMSYQEKKNWSITNFDLVLQYMKYDLFNEMLVEEKPLIMMEKKVI